MKDGRRLHPFGYFDSRLLRHYRSDPSQYVVHEDDNGGEIEGIGSDFFVVPFGFRRTSNGQQRLVVLDKDFAKVPANDVKIWNGYRCANEQFAEDDPDFEQWYETNFEISYAGEPGVFQRLRKAIALVQAVFRQALEIPLWKVEWNNQIGPPLAEDTESYATAHLEVYRVIVDGLEAEALQSLANRCGVSLTEPDKSMNSLKELLPTSLVDVVHKPLNNVRTKRHKKHGIPSAGVQPMAAREQFQLDMEDVVTALNSFAEWLGDQLQVDIKACLERDSIAQHGPWPRFAGPPWPNRKIDDLRRAVGKTIERVEFGAERREPDKSQLEAIVLHFTDGTAISIDITSNIGPLLENDERPSPEKVFEGLRVFWVPAISRNPQRSSGALKVECN